MDDTRLRTIEQLAEFLKATPQVAFTAHRQGGAGEDRRCEHISRVLTRFDDAHRNKRERGVVLALPEGGHLLACDISAEYTSIGRPQWQAADVAHRMELCIASALQTLDARLATGGAGSCDFDFIDADKTGYGACYERCLKLLRPGGLIAIDNVLWNGSVARPAKDADTAALQALNTKLHGDARVDISLLPIGDGLTLARKR